MFKQYNYQPVDCYTGDSCIFHIYRNRAEKRDKKQNNYYYTNIKHKTKPTQCKHNLTYLIQKDIILIRKRWQICSEAWNSNIVAVSFIIISPYLYQLLYTSIFTLTYPASKSESPGNFPRTEASFSGTECNSNLQIFWEIHVRRLSDEPIRRALHQETVDSSPIAIQY